jgi:hypothetical protein
MVLKIILVWLSTALSFAVRRSTRERCVSNTAKEQVAMAVTCLTCLLLELRNDILIDSFHEVSVTIDGKSHDPPSATFHNT